MKRWLLLIVMLSVPAAGRTVTYGIAIGYNQPPSSSSTLPVLQYADDDAVRYEALFSKFADQSFLLAALDGQTLRRYPHVATRVRPPTLKELRELIRQLTAKMKSDIARGDSPELYFTYSGHGAQSADGTAFLTLADGELTRTVLYDEVLAALPAGFLHLIVDACHAEAVVGSRGLFDKEGESKRAPVTAQEANVLVTAGNLRRFPHVGALLATTAGQESHEWSMFQSGIFTHEVLSGLSGAADVNGDEVIEYSELQAFVASANRDIVDPRALPQVVSLPPSLNPRVPLLTLKQLREVTFIEGDNFSKLGHFHVELDNGERYLDAHIGSDMVARLAVPADRTVFMVTDEQEAELRGPSNALTALDRLAFRKKRSESRGSVEASFRAALFQSSFGPTYYRGFVDSAQVPAVSFVARKSVSTPMDSRRVAAVTTLSVGGASLVAAAVLGGLAFQAKREFDATDFQRPAEEARSRYATFGTTAVVLGATAAALAVTGAVLWLGPRSSSVAITPAPMTDGGGLVLVGAF